MKERILIMLLNQLFNLISPDMLRKAINSGLEFVEKKIKETANAYDDASLFPVLHLIRMSLGIPDDTPEQFVSTSITGNALDKPGMLSTLMTSLFGMIPPDVVKGFIDTGLDVIENAIADSETKTDDNLLLPVISMIRMSFGIPDNDAQLITSSVTCTTERTTTEVKK